MPTYYYPSLKTIAITMILAGSFWATAGAQDYPYLEQIPIMLEAAPGKCIDLLNGSTANGTNIQIWDCSDGYPRQEWTLSGRQIKYGAQTDKCLSFAGDNAAAGSNIELQDCNSADRRQDWVYNALTKGFHSGGDPQKCLHLNGGNTANGTNIQLGNCNGQTAQRWEVDGAFTYDISTTTPAAVIHALDQSKCIDRATTSTANGTNIELTTCSDATPHYSWLLDGTPRTRLQLVVNNTDSGKCLDLSGGNTTNGNNIQLLDCQSGNKNQIWIFDGVTLSFRSGKDVNKCLDIAGGEPFADGANIRIWDCTDAITQFFDLREAPFQVLQKY